MPLYWLGTFGVFLVALLIPSWLNATTANLTDLARSLFLIPYKREDGGDVSHAVFGLDARIRNVLLFRFWISPGVLQEMGESSGFAPARGRGGGGRSIHASSTIPRFYSNPIILEFVLGMAVFAIWKRYRSGFNRFPVAAAPAFAGGCYTFLYLVESHVGRNSRLALQGLPSVVIVLCLLSLEGRVRFHRWLLAIGDASYSLYLFHPYVIQLVDKKVVALSVFTPLTLAASVGAILVCFVLAIVSFRVVERPSNEFLRRHFIKHRSRTPVASGVSI